MMTAKMTFIDSCGRAVADQKLDGYPSNGPKYSREIASGLFARLGLGIKIALTSF